MDIILSEHKKEHPPTIMETVYKLSSTERLVQ